LSGVTAAVAAQDEFKNAFKSALATAYDVPSSSITIGAITESNRRRLTTIAIAYDISVSTEAAANAVAAKAVSPTSLVTATKAMYTGDSTALTAMSVTAVATPTVVEVAISSTGVVVTFTVKSADLAVASSVQQALSIVKTRPQIFIANLKTELTAAGAAVPTGLTANVLTVNPTVEIYGPAPTPGPAGLEEKQVGGSKDDENDDVVIILGVLAALLGLVVVILTYSYCNLWNRISEQDKMLEFAADEVQQQELSINVNRDLHAKRQGELDRFVQEEQLAAAAAATSMLSPPTAAPPVTDEPATALLLSPPTAQPRPKSLSAMPPVADGQLLGALQDYQEQPDTPPQELRYYEGQMPTLRDAAPKGPPAETGTWVVGPGQSVEVQRTPRKPVAVAGFILDLASPPPTASVMV
jgi:hypothetical protein